MFAPPSPHQASSSPSSTSAHTQELLQPLSSPAFASQLADTRGWGSVAQASACALPSPQPKPAPDSSFLRPLTFLCETSVNSAPAVTPSRSGRSLFPSSRFSPITAHGAWATLFPGTNHQPLSTKPFTIRTYRNLARNPFRIRTYKTQDLKPFRMNTYKKTRGKADYG